MNGLNDGGPAFPIPPVGTGDPRDGMSQGSYGMTLRDWFAGQALAGLLANPGMIDTHNESAMQWVSSHAFHQADAMLIQREKGGAE